MAWVHSLLGGLLPHAVETQGFCEKRKEGNQPIARFYVYRMRHGQDARRILTKSIPVVAEVESLQPEDIKKLFGKKIEYLCA